MRSKKLICTLLAIKSCTGFSQVQVNVLPANEYSVFERSSEPQIKVRLLGALDKPGIYNVPAGMKLLDVVTYAGGAGRYSSGKVTIYGENNVKQLEYLSKPFQEATVQKGDTIFFEESIREDMPLYLQIIGTVVSLSTLIIVLGRNP